jgi:hypothetical protein
MFCTANTEDEEEMPWTVCSHDHGLVSLWTPETNWSVSDRKRLVKRRWLKFPSRIACHQNMYVLLLLYPRGRYYLAPRSSCLSSDGIISHPLVHILVSFIRSKLNSSEEGNCNVCRNSVETSYQRYRLTEQHLERGHLVPVRLRRNQRIQEQFDTRHHNEVLTAQLNEEMNEVLDCSKQGM